MKRREEVESSALVFLSGYNGFSSRGFLCHTLQGTSLKHRDNLSASVYLSCPGVDTDFREKGEQDKLLWVVEGAGLWL